MIEFKYLLLKGKKNRFQKKSDRWKLNQKMCLGQEKVFYDLIRKGYLMLQLSW